MKAATRITGFLITSLFGSLLTAAEIRYQMSGDYHTVAAGEDSNGWQAGGGGEGGLPGKQDTARINWGSNQVTLSKEAPEVGSVQIGVDESGNLIIEKGGSLTTAGSLVVGCSNHGDADVQAKLTVNKGGKVLVGDYLMLGAEAATGQGSLGGSIQVIGGEIEVKGHLWVAAAQGTTATIDIADGGKLMVSAGNIGLGTVDAAKPSGGTATISVSAKGSLVLHQWDPVNSIAAGSTLKVNPGGKVYIKGNHVDAAKQYLKDGKIATDGKRVDVDYDAGNDTTILKCSR